MPYNGKSSEKLTTRKLVAPTEVDLTSQTTRCQAFVDKEEFLWQSLHDLGHEVGWEEVSYEEKMMKMRIAQVLRLGQE